MEKVLRTNDNTLSLFIAAYCFNNNILCDGDIFGIAFSGANEYTIAHAKELIDQFADLYCLRDEITL